MWSDAWCALGMLTMRHPHGFFRLGLGEDANSCLECPADICLHPAATPCGSWWFLHACVMRASCMGYPCVIRALARSACCGLRHFSMPSLNATMLRWCCFNTFQYQDLRTPFSFKLTRPSGVEKRGKVWKPRQTLTPSNRPQTDLKLTSNAHTGVIP